MARNNVKIDLLNTLEDLSGENFKEFCHQLLDRRQEPRVRRCRVEGKSRLEIADVLVCTFTEEGAVRVTVELLQEIDCQEDAQKLGDGRLKIEVWDQDYIQITADYIQTTWKDLHSTVKKIRGGN